MRSMFLISEVAVLAKSLETELPSSTSFDVRGSHVEAVFGWRERCMTEEDPLFKETAQMGDESKSPAAEAPDLFDDSGNGLSSSQRSLIKQALEDWEEPERTSTMPVSDNDRTLRNRFTVCSSQCTFVSQIFQSVPSYSSGRRLPL